MHDIEPYPRWRDHYIASEDDKSPFYGNEYDEFRFTNKVYNYLIHPQWDQFGSSTLYMKILYADYDQGYAIFEFIGEWNDCIDNDVMFLKRRVIDSLLKHQISKYILICENVLNFHGSENDYYEEWYEEVAEEDGWICFINTLDHVIDEMGETQLYHYVNFGNRYNNINWRIQKPRLFCMAMDRLIRSRPHSLTDG